MKKALPPVYFLGAIIVEVLLHFLLPVRQFLVFPWRLLGLVFLVIGIVLNALADQKLKKHETTVKPFEGSAGTLLGSATAFAVVPVFTVLLDRIFIVQEEQMLEDTFGDQFRQYRNRVRRWI